MDTFPELHTPRLKLRKIQVEDIPCLLKYGNNKKISDYVLNIPYPYNEPDAVFRISYVLQGFKHKTRYVFAIQWKESGEFIGEISLHMDSARLAQMGYWIGEPFWNKGIVTEAVKAVLEFGFSSLGLEKIYATCHSENGASGKVLEKNGMKTEGGTGNVLVYAMTKNGP